MSCTAHYPLNLLVYWVCSLRFEIVYSEQDTFSLQSTTSRVTVSTRCNICSVYSLLRHAWLCLLIQRSAESTVYYVTCDCLVSARSVESTVYYVTCDCVYLAQDLFSLQFTTSRVWLCLLGAISVEPTFYYFTFDCVYSVQYLLSLQSTTSRVIVSTHRKTWWIYSLLRHVWLCLVSARHVESIFY
jgi:hypothetical protein